MADTTEKLLPCPFCGEPATKDHDSNGLGAYWIVCDNVRGKCGCEGPYCDTPEEASAAWNRRAACGTQKPVAFLSGAYRSVIEGKAERLPLGAEVSFVNLNWPGQIELYAQPDQSLR
jgi:hypothetical protein